MSRGDIYNIEGTGRSVLVISSRPFNQITRLPIVLPITPEITTVNAGFCVGLINTRTTGTIHCDQPCTLDLAALQAKNIESIDKETLQEVMARIATILA